MGTYLINYVRIRDGVPNQEGLAQLKRTVEAYGGRWLSHREEPRVEGARGNSPVLLEFGTMQEAQNWYNSSDYDDILHLYLDNAIDLVLVDGVSPDFTMAGFAQEERPLSHRTRLFGLAHRMLGSRTTFANRPDAASCGRHTSTGRNRRE